MAHYEFSAGPATLPSGVLAEAQRQLVDHDGLGRSLVEMSHRGKTVTAVVQEAEATLRELLAVPDDYAVLFMQGGGTGQFAAVPLNLSGPAQGATVADYITTGTWTAKAVAEAKKYIDARELVNAKVSGARRMRDFCRADVALQRSAAGDCRSARGRTHRASSTERVCEMRGNGEKDTHSDVAGRSAASAICAAYFLRRVGLRLTSH